MKRTFLSLFLFLSINSYCQFQVDTINIFTNDLVYDSFTDRIYVSMPSANGANGNSIGIINSGNHTLENTVFMGSEPGVLAISDDGLYIYAGFNTSSLIRRFLVIPQLADLQFSLGNDPFTGPYFAEDIEVMPGQSTTIAVSRKNAGFSPRHEGVVVYDNDTMRPIVTPGHTGANKIEFMNDSTLLGYNNETTEFGIRKFAITQTGISQTSVTQNVMNGFSHNFIYNNNKMYADDGKNVDVTSTPLLVGQFTNVNGPAVYDQVLNLVCYASYNFNGNISFKRYNPTTFINTTNFPVNQVNGVVKSIITCGNGCYAFNTDSTVVILKDPNAGVDFVSSENKILAYPNPTKQFLFFSSTADINNLLLTDLNGMALNVNLHNNRLDLGDLARGFYLISFSDKYQNVYRQKILKN